MPHLKTYLVLFPAIMAAIGMQSAHAESYFVASNIVGCGTIKSIRRTDQEPLPSFDLFETKRNYRAGANTGSTFGQLLSGGVIGLATAIVGTVVADAAIDSSKTHPPVVGQGERFGKKLLALQIAMDDGREVNLPEIEPINKLFALSSYQEGMRLVLAYNEIENALIIGWSESSHRPGDSGYEKECGLRLEKEKADAILKASEHLVDESLILQK